MKTHPKTKRTLLLILAAALCGCLCHCVSDDPFANAMMQQAGQIHLRSMANMPAAAPVDLAALKKINAGGQQ